MSKELEQYLAPGTDIPWDSAAAFFIATREATIVKTAAGITKEEIQEAKQKGLLSGIRSSTAADVTQATKTVRQRGQRIGKELGTLGGAAAGLLAGRRGGAVGKIGGSAIGALLGRSAGKTLGEEIDRARTMSRYTKPATKKAEIEKQSGLMRPEQPTAKELIPGRGPGARAERTALREKLRAGCPVGEKIDEELGKKVASVRHLWKTAQGLSSGIENVEGAGTPGGVSPLDEATMQGLAAQGRAVTPMEPNVVKPSGAPTPEDLEYEQAMGQLKEDMALDEAAAQNEAEHYRQVAEESQMQLQQMEQALAEAQQAAQQATQQADMSQQQADAASQQLQGQAQQDAAEKEQLNEEALGARDTIMKMRQAMQAYRENLQQLALQDPIAQAGPSPEEQGMEMAPSEAMAASGADEKAVREAEEAENAEAEANMQSAQAEQAAGEEATKQKEQQAAAKEAEAMRQGPTKTSTVRRLWLEKRALGLKTRALGAALGAAGGAGIQALSDRKSKGGMSEKERVLKAKLQHLKAVKDPSVLQQHKRTITRALADTAEINRKHPGSAAAMAAITGALAGATLAPSVKRLAGRMIRR